MKPKGNSIERRIAIARESIERNKDRKQRREKAEAKLQKLLQLKEELEREQAEKEAEKTRKKEERRLRNLQMAKTRYWEIHTPVYRTNDMQRESREEDLYTKEELMNPPEEETGRIRWDVWERLIEEIKIKLFKV